MRALILALGLGCHLHAPRATRGLPLTAPAEALRLAPQVMPPSGTPRLAVSPGGSRALIYGDDGLVTVWQLRSGAVLGQAPLSLAGVRQVIWHETDALLVLDDTGELHREPLDGGAATLLDRRACALALSADREELLVAHDSGQVTLLDLETGASETLGRWEGCPRVGWIDADAVLVGDDQRPPSRITLEGEAADREVGTSEPLDAITTVAAIASGADHALLVSGHQVWRVDRTDAAPLGQVLPDGEVTRLVAIADTAYAVEIQGEDGPDVRYASAPMGPLMGLYPGAATVAALPGDGLLVGLAGGGAVVLNPNQLPVPLVAPQAPTAGIAAGGQRLLQPAANDALLLWDLRAGRLERSWTLPGLVATALSPNGAVAAASTDQGELYRWSPDQDALPRALAGAGQARSLALARDGTLAVGTMAGKAVIIGPEGDFRSAVTVADHGDVLVAITPDGAVGLAAGEDGDVVLFVPATGQELNSRRRLSMRPRAVALTAHGEVAYIAGDRGRRRGGVWALQDSGMREIGPPELRVPVLSLALPPARRDLMVALGDGRVCALPQDERRGKLSCIATSSTLTVGLAFVRGAQTLLIGGTASGAAELWRDKDHTWMATLAGARVRGEEQWAVAGPGGRYDSSWSGDVGFASLVVTPEAGLAESSVALWQVRDSLYTDDLLHRVLGGSVPAAPALAAVAAAPDVYAQAPVVVADPVVARVCVVERGAPAGALQVRLNGWQVDDVTPTAEVCAAPDGAAGVTWTATIARRYLRDPLSSNQIAVTALDTSTPPHAGTALLLPVLEAAPGDGAGLVVVDGAATALPPPDGVRALVVGVSDYSEPAEGRSLDLAWPAEDARGVATAIRAGAKAAGKRAAVALLTGEEGSNARREIVLAALQEVAAEADPSEVLVVFLAGHGATIDGSWRFFTSDATTTAPAADAARVSVSTEEIANALRGTRARHVVLVLDTCASGQAAQDLAALTERAGIYVLAASRGAAQESDVIGHGLLTWSLLNVLTSPDLLTDRRWWDLDRVLPLASEGVAQVAREHGLTVTQQPVVARPPLQERVDIGAIDQDLRATLKLQDTTPRVSLALLEASTLVDQGGLTEQLQRALTARADPVTVISSSGAWMLGGLYSGLPDARCATVHLYRGPTPRAEATFRGADEALIQDLADWAYACVSGGACAERPAEEPCP